jgi:citrate synthase
MGFGHRVPQLRSARHHHQEARLRVFEVTGKNPLIDIALKRERISLQDDYFITRKLARTSTSTPASSMRRWAFR